MARSPPVCPASPSLIPFMCPLGLIPFATEARGALAPPHDSLRPTIPAAMSRHVRCAAPVVLPYAAPLTAPSQLPYQAQARATTSTCSGSGDGGLHGRTPRSGAGCGKLLLCREQHRGGSPTKLPHSVQAWAPAAASSTTVICPWRQSTQTTSSGRQRCSYHLSCSVCGRRRCSSVSSRRTCFSSSICSGTREERLRSHTGPTAGRGELPSPPPPPGALAHGIQKRHEEGHRRRIELVVAAATLRR
jgi:hypothetical protein